MLKEYWEMYDYERDLETLEREEYELWVDAIEREVDRRFAMFEGLPETVVEAA
jgi:hypothetical protein